METTPKLDRSRVDRRSFLLLAGIGALAPSIVAGCGSGGSSSSAPTAAASADTVLPNYVPIEYAAPDIPGVNGSTPGYTRLPDELVRQFDTPPGSGSEFTAMTPLWGVIPPTSGNTYFEAVNAAIGSTIRFQISDGNTYGDRLAAVLSSERDVPDWVTIPTWNTPPRFDQAVGQLFEDLNPFLAGDAVEAYPNLANIPTDVWRFCIFDGHIRALPFPGDIITDATFYRDDIFADEGITTLPTNAQELLDLCAELTGGGRWGANDLWGTANRMYGVVPSWQITDDGHLLHKVETEEYRAALAWNAALFAQGSVHPDAVADSSGDYKDRLESGSVLITDDGVGGWHEALTRQLGSNPTYSQRPFTPFGADGSDPVLFKGAPANIFSFLKKNDDKDKIAELLEAANFLASPFGTVERQLIDFGIEGEHFTVDGDGVPVASDLAATELQPSYVFLANAPLVSSEVQFPDYVEAFCSWMAVAAQHVHEPAFYGMQITEPNQFASLGQPFEDLEKDISRGRAGMDELDAAIDTWRTSGGEELRDFYQEILDESS